MLLQSLTESVSFTEPRGFSKRSTRATNVAMQAGHSFGPLGRGDNGAAKKGHVMNLPEMCITSFGRIATSLTDTREGAGRRIPRQSRRIVRP
jgi:hypothetical protein